MVVQWRLPESAERAVFIYLFSLSRPRTHLSFVSIGKEIASGFRLGKIPRCDEEGREAY